MFSVRLSSLRKEKNKTQQQLADYLGLTRPAYTAYERGNRQPDYETLDKIADYFDVSTDYLLGRTDKPEVNKFHEGSKEFFMNRIATEFPDIDLMFKDMESLSAEDMKEVYEYIKFKMSQKKQK